MRTRTRVALGVRGVLFLVVLSLVLCCRSSKQTSIDGETHFLKACTGSGSECGARLTCECGVCVQQCSETADCTSLLASAQCVSSEQRPKDACIEPPARSICDAPCSADEQCGVLGFDYFCSSGFCRQDSRGGAGGGGGQAGVDGSSEACPPGDTSGNDVVILGDVFVAQTRDITRELETLAREAGALAATENYRDYSSATQNSLTVENALLRDRYLEAQAESSARVIVMNGGGSDLLLKSCEASPTPDCQLMVDILAGAEQLLSRMASDGVDDVVWFYYPDPMDADLLAELDVLRPLLEDACDESPVPCHWVDLRAAFDGRYAEYMQSDFVPTAEGAQAAATGIWSVMERDCVAQ